MTDENIWQLIILKFTGEATPQQLAVLEQALKENPELGFQVSILEEVWKNKQSGRVPLPIQDSYNRHLQRLSNHWSAQPLQYDTEAQEPVPARTGIKHFIYSHVWAIGAIAACVVLVFMMAIQYGRHQPSRVPVAQNLVSTRNGSKTKLQLPDGTEVWLNSGSKIAYDNDFTGATRRVTLKGEAFFEVVKDASRPFIIHTDVIDVTVLGTAFNVRAYPDEKVTETALIRGAIEVTLHRNPDKKLILKPNEKLIVKNDTIAGKAPGETSNRSTPILTVTQVHFVNQGKDTASMETLWTRNKLVFDNEPLQQVALKIERWYGVKVTIQSDRLKNVEYSGVFEDENLSEVLYALQVTGNFNYTIHKNDVIIKP